MTNRRQIVVNLAFAPGERACVDIPESEQYATPLARRNGCCGTILSWAAHHASFGTSGYYVNYILHLDGEHEQISIAEEWLSAPDATPKGA